MEKNVFILILLQICTLPVFTQRGARQQAQLCNTPDNFVGACITLSNCPSLANYGRYTNNPQVVSYLVGLKRNCGNRVYNGDPVVCCKEAYRGVQQITTKPPTRPPVRLSTLPPVQVSTPPPFVPPTQESRANSNCYGPDAKIGVCRSIKQCPSVLNLLVQHKNNQTVLNYLKQSNELCESVGNEVCCPTDEQTAKLVDLVSTPTEQPSNNNFFINRLPGIEDGCGVSKSTFKKIVGGVDSKLGAWPWIALLGYERLGEIDFKCGGTLITQKHILTAAHCLRNNLKMVRLGEHDLKTDQETQHLDVPVERFVKHPSYTSRDGFADIAILYLQNNVQFSDRIKPICLPKSPTLRSKSYVDYTPFVVGWGRTQEGGTSATVLQELQIPVYDNSVCVRQYQKQGKYISERQFGNTVLCAGVEEGGKDTCQGDSGGPLMIPEMVGKTFYFFELGVVSYGIGCARPEVPGVYTSVQQYMDWIEQNVVNTK